MQKFKIQNLQHLVFEMKQKMADQESKLNKYEQLESKVEQLEAHNCNLVNQMGTFQEEHNVQIGQITSQMSIMMRALEVLTSEDPNDVKQTTSPYQAHT